MRGSARQSPAALLTRCGGSGRSKWPGEFVGIANLGEILEEVKDLDLATDTEIRTELLKRVKEANYVPRGMDDVYGDAVLSKYREQASSLGRGCCGR